MTILLIISKTLWLNWYACIVDCKFNPASFANLLMCHIFSPNMHKMEYTIIWYNRLSHEGKGLQVSWLWTLLIIQQPTLLFYIYDNRKENQFIIYDAYEAWTTMICKLMAIKPIPLGSIAFLLQLSTFNINHISLIECMSHFSDNNNNISDVQPDNGGGIFSTYKRKPEK